MTIDGRAFAVSDVKFAYQPGGSFRIDAGDARHPGQTCSPDVARSLSLSGRLPEGVNSPVELSDKEVLLEASGAGQPNLCFTDSQGLLGVKAGSVKFGRVFGGAIGFTFDGDFTRLDGKGGTADVTVHASGNGTATVQ